MSGDRGNYFRLHLTRFHLSRGRRFPGNFLAAESENFGVAVAVYQGVWGGEGSGVRGTGNILIASKIYSL